MSNPAITVAKSGDLELSLLLCRANRHGCITGATGTGKTVTLQRLAQAFSDNGVPVFMADVKGDLAGIAQPGSPTPKLRERLARLGVSEPKWEPCPALLWDIWGKTGHPVRITAADLGPLLLQRVLNLNETQAGVLNIAFKLADERGLLALDLKDLRALVQYVGEHAAELRTSHGQVSSASVGAILRALSQLEEQGADVLLGEPMLEISDLMRVDEKGRGLVSVLSADRLLQMPRLYAMCLLWLLAELFEQLPEVGDVEKPKLVFFFDEAHLLFDSATPALLEKIELVVRLIRSKGVGLYFVTQSPLDIPDAILGQLGNRIQHALRAFTKRDQKAVQAVAETMRPNPALDLTRAIQELSVGEALISLLDEQGVPGITQRAFVLPPSSRIGALTEAERAALIKASPVAAKYARTIDRASAYEELSEVSASDHEQAPEAPRQKPAARRGKPQTKAEAPQREPSNALQDLILGSTGPRGGHRDGLIDVFAKSAVREISRGLFGSLLGNNKRRR